jgi:N6-L-threonylcarbamoyladenine synthase
VKFALAQIKHADRKTLPGGTKKVAVGGQSPYDFSFSGIKTAVLRYVEKNHMQAAAEERRRRLATPERPKFDDVLAATDPATRDLVASFQHAVVADLVGRTCAAAEEFGARTLFVTGGVAANSELRRRFEEAAPQQGLAVYFHSLRLSTDNAAMIAAAAYPKFLLRDFAPPDLSAEAGLRLG